MAKRFTDTNKYKSPFFRSLQGAYKVLWDFLYHDCDHAGVWIVDFEIAQAYVGKDLPVSREGALSAFNTEDETRVIEIDNGKKWFLPGFPDFQYGPLKENNRTHASVINILARYNLIAEDLSIIINKPLVSPLQGAKDKDKDKDKDFGKSENLLTEETKLQSASEVKTGLYTGPKLHTGATVLMIPEMQAVWSASKPDYIFTDDCRPALRRIGEYIAKAKNIVDWEGFEGVSQVRETWKTIVEFIQTDSHYRDYTLYQVAKYLNGIISKLKNHLAQPENTGTGKKSIIQNNVAAANNARNILNDKYGQENEPN